MTQRQFDARLRELRGRLQREQNRLSMLSAGMLVAKVVPVREHVRPAVTIAAHKRTIFVRTPDTEGGGTGRKLATRTVTR